jgi:hypothetical protein
LWIILNEAQRFFERGFGNKHSANPVLNQTARQRHNAVTLDRLRHYCSGQKAKTNLRRVVKPEEILAAPARLHFGFCACDVAIEGLDGLGFQIDGGADTGAQGQSANDENQPDQVQSAPTNFLAVASTTSR